jgi:hypothetical protein
MLVERRKAWGEDRVYFHDDMGNLKRMPAGWTSAAPPNAFETVSAGRSHFRIEDLLQLTMLIARYTETTDIQKGTQASASCQGNNAICVNVIMPFDTPAILLPIIS